jgi:CRP/FNR family transcriptional regulator
LREIRAARLDQADALIGADHGDVAWSDHCCGRGVTKDSTLQTFGFYQSASAPEQLVIREAAVVVRLAEGAVFYREGEENRHFAVVARGDIRVFRTASNGREVTLYHVRDGQPCLIALLCALLGRRAMATAVVEEPTDAVLVPSDVFRKLLTTNDALQKYVFEMMAVSVVDMLTLVEEIAVRRMDARLASWLARQFAAQRTEAAILATHDEIAAELGTVREVVSRLLKEFERKGAVRLFRGRVVLADDRVLSGFAAEAQLTTPPARAVAL